MILRAGAKSLHPSWLGDSGYRNWDLVICPYQPTLFTSEPGVTVMATTPGYKWTGLTAVLNTWPAGRHWSEYQSIWLPDDDLFLPQDKINALFDVSQKLQAKLSAPALHESSFSSYLVTMRNAAFVARKTNFVEIMMPCFAVETLRQLLPTFALTSTGLGWGLDFLWPKLLQDAGIYVIDSVAALHTRPVHSAMPSELADHARLEGGEMLRAYEPPYVGRTLGGYDGDFKFISENEPHFMTHLLRGWQYLLDADASVIRQILAIQGYRR